MAHIHCCLKWVMGPHPFPAIVRNFRVVISGEIRAQLLEREEWLADVVIACAGRTSMSKIADAFAHGKAFIPFITCGDPDLENHCCHHRLGRCGKRYRPDQTGPPSSTPLPKAL